MALPKTHFFLLFHVIITLTTTTSAASNDLTTLIYKGCANQNFQTNPTQTLTTLFNNLVQRSSSLNFFKATVNSTIPVTGLYQCRGDLSHADCNTCVQTLQNTIQTVCDPNTLAARAHLTGCYMLYEALNFPQAPDTEVLYKKCGSGRVGGSGSGGGSGFEEKMEVVFGMVVKGVGEGKGYYAGGYERVYVLGQCEGDLGEGECVNCVRNASLVAKGECLDNGFVSGHVYLQRCWLSYTFYPDGVPGGGDDSGSRNGDSGGGAPVETGAAEVGGGGGGGGGKRNTEKTVAIVFGGLAVVLLLVAFLLVVKSAFKKKEHYYYHGDHAGHHHVGH
ncbi:Gnk2-homologous domain-containing protein [Artemisia annua]|uniref:Gnk2-homologous domain-containing protein n=1 Tax=Artemisia annua TaxID=35608 RepID=A0A2U1Q656_ARTAN|nr:Gnk2-homologous domain-containing protein [Artemisia annua]